MFLKLLKKGYKSKKPRIVFIGDSITHGHVGIDYISILNEKLLSIGINAELINAGVNSEFAWNVNNRLDPLIK